MTTQQFIERAIEGGWKPEAYDFAGKTYSWKVQAVSKIKFKERIFLQPDAWKAVGKVEGWGTTDYCWGCGYDEGATEDTPIWKVNMHSMIDALAEGKTIEEYLATL